VEDGLAAPISFNDELVSQRMKSISENVVVTNLEAAVDFIMALETREAAVVGIQPEPAFVAEVLKDLEGRELTRLPSTQWVSDEKAAEWGWGGRGRLWDEVHAVRWEKRGLHGYKLSKLMLQMQQEGRELPARVTIDGITTISRTEGVEERN